MPHKKKRAQIFSEQPILGSGRSPGGGDGNPLQCSCLENSMDRGAWWTTVHGITKSRTQLSMYARINNIKATTNI